MNLKLILTTILLSCSIAINAANDDNGFYLVDDDHYQLTEDGTALVNGELKHCAILQDGTKIVAFFLKDGSKTLMCNCGVNNIYLDGVKNRKHIRQDKCKLVHQ